MKATFVETTEFTESIIELMPDLEYARLQLRMMANPNAGAAMAGCGGLRKIRVGDSSRGKGKRGGARVIYLFLPFARRFYMLDVYGKNERADLSATEKRQLKKLAERLKSEASRKGN